MNVTKAASEELLSTVAVLPDHVLLERTRMLARHEQALQLCVFDHLREIEGRRLYLRLGFSSLFDYTVRELHYTEAAAWRRIKAMRLCRETRGVRAWLQDGSLNLSNAALLQNSFERWDRSAGGRIATGRHQRRAACRLGSIRDAGRGTGCAIAGAGCSRPAAAGRTSGGQEHAAGATDAGRGGSRGGGAGRAAARAGGRALGAESGDRRRVPARTAAAAGVAVPRGSAPDGRAARGAAGEGGSGALRPEPAAAPEAEVRLSGWRAFVRDSGAGDGRSLPQRRRGGGDRADFGGEAVRGSRQFDSGSGHRRRRIGGAHFGGEVPRGSRQFDTGAEDRRRRGASFGGEAPQIAGQIDSGCGEARGLAA